jgi:hypothetical protein
MDEPELERDRDAVEASREYQAIAAWYGDRRAQRSGVRLMAHIDEGLRILRGLGASERARRAFCLHPLVQQDDDLARSWDALETLSDDVRVVALALEYRNIANATLSPRDVASAEDIPLSPLADVNELLRADKIQNYKDFLLHHHGTHPRSAALDRYFRLWLERLGVARADFARWFTVLQGPMPRPLPDDVWRAPAG